MMSSCTQSCAQKVPDIYSYFRILDSSSDPKREPTCLFIVCYLKIALSCFHYVFCLCLKQVIHRLPVPFCGDELHHSGWNACSRLVNYNWLSINLTFVSLNRQTNMTATLLHRVTNCLFRDNSHGSVAVTSREKPRNVRMNISQSQTEVTGW